MRACVRACVRVAISQDARTLTGTTPHAADKSMHSFNNASRYHIISPLPPSPPRFIAYRLMTSSLFRHDISKQQEVLDECRMMVPQTAEDIRRVRENNTNEAAHGGAIMCRDFLLMPASNETSTAHHCTTAHHRTAHHRTAPRTAQPLSTKTHGELQALLTDLLAGATEEEAATFKVCSPSSWTPVH